MDNPKLDKYDDAFLFSLGLVGLIISLIEIRTSSYADIASVIPFLLLGILLPFVIGYLRGAIQQNSIEERMRGWIYFLIGTTSYFAFFVITRIGSLDYWVRESIFIFIIAIGATSAYEFTKWSKRLFELKKPLTYYAFSATALGVLGFSTFFSLIVGIYFDFQVNNIWEKIRTNLTGLLFWGSIVLFVFSMVLIFEKGSRYAIQSEFELQNEHELIKRYPSWLRGVWSFFPVKGLFLGFVLFEYSFDFNLEARNLQARTLWMFSFVFWCVGCLFMNVDLPVASSFFALVIISSTVAATCFYKSKIYDFRGINKTYPTKIVYVSMIFVIAILIVLSGNTLQLIVLMILWTLLSVVISRAQAER